MTAQTHIVLDTAQHALIIPVAALGERSADGTYPVRAVMLDGSVNTRTVHTGIGNDMSVQVLSGLSEGEEVIIGEAQDASADASSISK